MTSVPRPPKAQSGRLRAAKSVLAYVPFIACCAAIYVVSDLPQPSIPDALTFRFSDKLLHAAAYSVVGAAAAFAATVRRLPKLDARVIIEGATLAVLAGVFDEFHQSFVPGRSSTASDVGADGIGAVIGAVLLYRAHAAWRARRDTSGDRRSGAERTEV